MLWTRRSLKGGCGKLLMSIKHNMTQVSYVTHGPVAQNLFNKKEFKIFEALMKLNRIFSMQYGNVVIS